MSERKQPDRIAKKRTNEMMMAKSKPRKFDLIGELLSNYGEPDITREIFSYVDFTTLQQSQLVSKSWNHYLANDKKIWLQAMEKHLPNLIYLTNQLAENEEENSTWWKEVWISIKKADEPGTQWYDYSLKEIIQAFKQVQSIFEILKICLESKQKRFENLKMVDYLPQNFNDDFVGEKVKKEIRREIKRGEKRKFMVVLQRNIGDLEQVKRWRSQMQIIYGPVNQATWYPKAIRRIKDKILLELNNYLLNVEFLNVE